MGKFIESGSVAEKRPAVKMSIPKARAIVYKDGLKQEGVMRDDEILVPFPGDELPDNDGKAKFFLDHINYLKTTKGYKYLGHIHMDGSKLADALDSEHGAVAKPKAA